MSPRVGHTKGDETMCAIPDKATTEEFRKRKGPQRAYKILVKSSARPSAFTNSGVSYRPGRNVDRNPVKTYLGYVRGCERGFHCYLSRAHACKVRDQISYKLLTIVCVTFDPADVIVAESTHCPWGGSRGGTRQIVVRALHISKRAWKQAGLPAMEGGAS